MNKKMILPENFVDCLEIKLSLNAILTFNLTRQSEKVWLEHFFFDIGVLQVWRHLIYEVTFPNVQVSDGFTILFVILQIFDSFKIQVAKYKK